MKEKKKRNRPLPFSFLLPQFSFTSQQSPSLPFSFHIEQKHNMDSTTTVSTIATENNGEQAATSIFENSQSVSSFHSFSLFSTSHLEPLLGIDNLPFWDFDN